MAEPVKKDDALAAAVREAFQRHMENARLAALPVSKPSPIFESRSNQDRRSGEDALPAAAPAARGAVDAASPALAQEPFGTLVTERPAVPAFEDLARSPAASPAPTVIVGTAIEISPDDDTTGGRDDGSGRDDDTGRDPRRDDDAPKRADDDTPRLPTVGTSRADQRISAPIPQPRLPSVSQARSDLRPSQDLRQAPAMRTVEPSPTPSPAPLRAERGGAAPVPARTGELMAPSRRIAPTRMSGDLAPPALENRFGMEPMARAEQARRRTSDNPAEDFRFNRTAPQDGALLPSRQPRLSDRAPVERQLAAPSPANDREIRGNAGRERDRLAALATKGERTGRAAATDVSARSPDLPRDLDLDPRPVARTTPPATHEPPPARGKRPALPQRDAANLNRESRFGSGGRSELRSQSLIRWAIIGAVVLAVALCIGAGVYIWSRSAATIPAQVPAGKVPAGKTDAAPAAQKPAQQQSVLTPGSTGTQLANARSVKTNAIHLDAVDLAVQDARERAAGGDIPAARSILERYRERGDSRALVGLAETYDPSVVTDATYADSKQAQALYEAAGKAGFKDTAERLAKLQLRSQ